MDQHDRRCRGTNGRAEDLAGMHGGRSQRTLGDEVRTHHTVFPVQEHYVDLFDFEIAQARSEVVVDVLRREQFLAGPERL